MIKTLEIETETIPSIAKLYINSAPSDTLHKELHDALNNIFTKGHKDSDDSHVSKRGVLEYRKAMIISQKAIQVSRLEHRVIRGRKASIYNALCLYTLLGTAGTKKVFHEYYSSRFKKDKREFKLLNTLSKKELSTEMLFFGVSQRSFDNIKNKLLDDSFDLFTDKLPSPFQSLKNNETDLSPLAVLYDRDINWQKFIEIYIQSDKNFKAKKYIEAKDTLQEISDKRLLRLSLVKALSANVNAAINENEEAWEYLQNILN